MFLLIFYTPSSLIIVPIHNNRYAFWIVMKSIIMVIIVLVSFFKDTVNKNVFFNQIQPETYLSPGRSLTLAVISAASGTSFSTSSRGPQKDLFCPRKVFLAKEINTKQYF